MRSPCPCQAGVLSVVTHGGTLRHPAGLSSCPKGARPKPSPGEGERERERLRPGLVAEDPTVRARQSALGMLSGSSPAGGQLRGKRCSPGARTARSPGSRPRLSSHFSFPAASRARRPRPRPAPETLPHSAASGREARRARPGGAQAEEAQETERGS